MITDEDKDESKKTDKGGALESESDSDEEGGEGDTAGKKRKRRKSKSSAKDVEAMLSRKPAALMAADRFQLTSGGALHEHKGKKKARKAYDPHDEPSSSDDEDSDKDPLAVLKAAFGGSGKSKGKGKEKRAALSKATKRSKLVSEQGTCVKLPPGAIFEPLPDTDPTRRYTAYVAGRSGSGKSQFSSGLLRRYAALYPKRYIYGVCSKRLSKDPAYQGIDIKQINATEVFGGTPDLEKLFGDEGCMILFDDWDSMKSGDKLLVQYALTDILNTGRKLGISAVVTNHLLTDHNRTKAILNEADWVTFFPRDSMPGTMKYLCEKIGLPVELVSHLRDMGRWVSVCNKPTMVLGENEAILV